MTARRSLSLVCLAALALLCAGCATAELRPAHVTILCERDDAEADGHNRQRTLTTKTGASLTWDLK